MRLSLPISLLAVLLSGCGDPEIKHARVPVDNSTSGELFWFDAKASDLIVITGDNGPDGVQAAAMAKALAWPDRLVMVAPTNSSQSCGALVAQAVKTVQDFAARTQRPAPSQPLLVGLDGDSAMAFAADPGAVEARAVVALNYCPTSAAARPACALSAATAATPAEVPVIAIPDTTRCTAADVDKTLGGFADARAISPVGGAIDLVSAVVSQVMGNVAERAEDGELDLPLVELPAQGKSNDDRLAIIVSGDGGWADIDRQVGEELSKRGVAVVGLDALKYFWRKKEPAEAAEDLGRIIDHYTTAWNRKRVVLIGYSFGADVIPFMWPKLSAAARAKVSHMALLALSPEASFEITVGGWVGVESREAVPTAPAVKAVTGTKVFCVQAGEDDEDPCPALGVDAIALPGDHHFDRDYKKLSTLILSRTGKPAR